MKFQIGQRVVFLNDQGGGVIQSINEKALYIIEDEDGFVRPYRENQLAEIQGEDYKVNDEDIAIIKEEALQTRVKHVTFHEVDRRSKHEIDVWEVDLHIENLIDSHRDLTNTEILRRQMSAFKLFFNKARSQSIRKMVVIHGVGEGVLKSEVRSFLDQLDTIEYYDSDFVEYGKGATTIEVNYSR